MHQGKVLKRHGSAEPYFHSYRADRQKDLSKHLTAPPRAVAAGLGHPHGLDCDTELHAHAWERGDCSARLHRRGEEDPGEKVCGGYQKVSQGVQYARLLHANFHSSATCEQQRCSSSRWRRCSSSRCFLLAVSEKGGLCSHGEGGGFGQGSAVGRVREGEVV